jgi:ferredoxin
MTGPVLEDGFDIQLVEAGDDYAVQIGSEKGLQLFENHKDRFGPPLDVDVAAMAEEAKGRDARFDLQKVYMDLKEQRVNEELFEDIGARCQSCGLCLFLCPTCSCYSVTDGQTPGGKNRRARQWDACYFRGFTRMAGGHDPVESRAEMAKRKYFHKLVYNMDEFGTSGCTGCGRCNLVCVGNVNWLDSIIRIEGRA